MALERQSIEKKDFPIGRRGYDPEAVDAHLHSLADEVDELKRSSRRRTETLASAASEQVRAIVEAAENSASEIQRQAEEEAHEIRAEAASEAQATREQATGQARDYVGKVSESTAVMLQRLDAMESELSALIDSLKTGSNRLNADLQLLEGNLTEVKDAVVPPRFEPEAEPAIPASAAAESVPFGSAPYGVGPAESATYGGEPVAAEAFGSASVEPAPEEAAPAEHEAAAEAEPHAAVEQAAGPAESEPYGTPEPEPYDGPKAEPEHVTGYGTEPAHEHEAEPAYGNEAEPAPAHGAEPGAGSDDTEGARLIALNMALNGTPREETDRYLAENFHLADRAALLDEVYASVEG